MNKRKIGILIPGKDCCQKADNQKQSRQERFYKESVWRVCPGHHPPAILSFQLLFLAGQKGWNEPCQEAESDQNIYIFYYAILGGKDHLAEHPPEQILERFATFLSGLRFDGVYVLQRSFFFRLVRTLKLNIISLYNQPCIFAN